MNTKLKSTNAILLIGGLNLAGWMVAMAQGPTNVQVFQADVGQQIVLETVAATDGKFWVKPKTQVFFRLGPKDALDRYAPLPPHSLMVCREFNYRGDMGEPHAGFRCGMDQYSIEAFGFNHETGTQGDVPAPGASKQNLGQPAGGKLY